MLVFVDMPLYLVKIITVQGTEAAQRVSISPIISDRQQIRLQVPQRLCPQCPFRNDKIS